MWLWEVDKILPGEIVVKESFNEVYHGTLLGLGVQGRSRSPQQTIIPEIY